MHATVHSNHAMLAVLFCGVSETVTLVAISVESCDSTGN